MSDDYVVAGKRKSKTDKRAKGRYSRYKKGGSMRTSGAIIINEPAETPKNKSGKKRKKKK